MSSTSQPTPPAAAPVVAVEAGAAPGSVREVLLLAYPVVLTQISMTAMGIVDSAMVGSLGATELGAVGFGGIWLWTFACFFMGTITGVQTFVSQRDGAGAARECGSWAWQGLYAVIPMALIAVAFLHFGASEMMRVLGPSPEIQPLRRATCPSDRWE